MYVSLESLNFPGRFVRHRNFLGELTEVVSDLDRHDATFSIGTNPGVGEKAWFRPVNFPLHALRHQDFRIKLHEWNMPLVPPGELGIAWNESPEQLLLREDATFYMRQGRADPGAVSFESFNFPGHFLRHRNFELFIDSADDDLARQDSTFVLREPFAPPSPLNLH
jgi:hypothetical protein